MNREAPAGPATTPARILVRRSLPTEPSVRGSLSLFLAEAERQGIRAGRKMLYIGLEPAAEQIAACLRVDPGEDVVARRKVLLADDVPVRIATSLFRAHLFAHTPIGEPEFVRPSLQAALTDLGHTFGRAEETLIARRATPFERATLELDADEWVVQIVRASYSADDVPVHTLETVCAASRHIFPIAQVTGLDQF